MILGGIPWISGRCRWPRGLLARCGYPGPGEDPYAAYNAVGYGDPGYSDPGYNGPSAQDAGVAGTRTVRGFVDPRLRRQRPPRPAPAPDYRAPDYRAPDYRAPQGHGPQGYHPAPDYGTGYDQQGGGAGYAQPWDYSQPLRYDDDGGYPGPGHPSGPYPIQGGYDGQARNPNGYNGSELSRPGIDGPGYDLSGIIGTSDFPAYGYDEPSVERLSYDDPRYSDDPRHSDGPDYGQQGYGQQYGDQQGWNPQAYNHDGQPGSRPGGPAFDDTRLDAFFGPDRADRGPYGGGSAPRREVPAAFAAPGAAPQRPAGARRNAETRMDLGFRALGMSQTRMDMQALRDEPRFDETRLDGMRAIGTGPMQARSATGLPRPAGRAADELARRHVAGLLRRPRRLRGHAGRARGALPRRRRRAARGAAGPRGHRRPARRRPPPRAQQ